MLPSSERFVLLPQEGENSIQKGSCPFTVKHSFGRQRIDRINRIQRRTTSAFELALAVLFTSGLQHYAEIPEGMAKAPEEVRNFVRNLPNVWDDMRFLDGYPGKFVVLARQANGRWYLSGINGEPTERDLTLDLGELVVKGSGTLITDGEAGPLSFLSREVRWSPGHTLQLTLQPHGGFVMVVE